MSEVATIDYNNLPDLRQMKPAGIDLVLNYWTPTEVGESKDVIYMGTKTLDSVSRENSDVVEQRPTVIMIEQNIDGTYTTLSNSSVKLVTAMQPIQKGTPLRVTYIGKQKNVTNSNHSDAWSLHRLTPVD